MKHLVAVMVLATILACLLALPSATAFESSTSGNNIQISNIGYAAHNYTGGNYTLDFSMVDQAVANSSSSNYSAQLGFYNPVLYLPPSGPFDIIVDAPYSVSTGAAVSSTVYLINKHPKTGGDYVVTYWIKDAQGNILVGPGQVTVLAPPLVTTETTVSLDAPASAGTYYFWARVSWGTGSYADASDPFIVSQAGAEGAGGPGGGAAPTKNLTNQTTGPGQPIAIEKKEGILQIVKQPMDIEVTDSSTRERLFYFMNIGEGNLSNVSLFLSGLPLDSFTIEPATYENIEPNEVAVFKLTFVGLLEPGEYKIKLIMTSDSGTDTMPGRVVVWRGSAPAKEPEDIASLVFAAALVVSAVVFLALFEYTRKRRGRMKRERAKRAKKYAVLASTAIGGAVLAAGALRKRETGRRSRTGAGKRRRSKEIAANKEEPGKKVHVRRKRKG